MKKLLLINACARQESRTRKLAEVALQEWLSQEGNEVEILNLYEEDLPLLDEEAIMARGLAAQEGDQTNPYVKYARQFQAADAIVVAAPFWDMGFPAILKTYIETVMVTGITFAYTPEGYPKGLCKAEKLLYITTAGGPILPEEFGYSYVKSLARNMWGIPDVSCVKAECLDIIGADVEGILAKAQEELKGFWQKKE